MNSVDGQEKDYQLICHSRLELNSAANKFVAFYKKNSGYIWAKYSLESKQNKVERAVFREKLETYLKAGAVAPDVFQVWFWDETGFSLRVLRRKCWARRGHQRLMSGKRSRGRVNVIGGLRYHDRKRCALFC